MVTWCINWRGLLALIFFQRSSLKLFPIIKRLAITLMYCDRLHAWWSTQSRLKTLISSSIARRWVGLQTLWRFWLKDLSIDKMVGAWYSCCLSGPPGFTCWISFASVFSFIYCWVLIFASSPCYILICVFWEMMHWQVRGLSCKPNIYVSLSTSELRVRLAPLNGYKASSKSIFNDRSKAVLLDRFC